jgi:oligopeptide/dipeptide ABC transporter ATP-binding protein
MDILKVENLYKKFPIEGKHNVCAVNGISFSIRSGETLGLVGESGCGKTTVGRMIVRLLDPTSGIISFEGQNLFEIPQKENMLLRREVQIVFQDPYGSLNPRKRVKDIIAESMRLDNITSKSQRYNKIIEILNMVELDKSYLNKLPIQLTQGEQQRIGVARAFVTNPKLVVLDEPTSLLDIRFRGEIVLLFKRLQKETGCAFLFISHDLNIIYQLSHTVAVMYLGRIVEQGSADKVFNQPKHPYTKALLSATLFPNPEQPRQDFFLVGEVPSPVDLPDNECNFAARCPYAFDVCRTALPKLVLVSEDQKVACFLLDSNL